ncbi:MAG: hypothetical protein LBR66_06585 [Candidatus Symbiothrix sp.]|jgi:hypothetical protein|nr:hypothetical protein [Candidatus Symbiothrix sp.]
MSTISVDILNPRAFNLLEELAGLNLIAIRKESSKTDDFVYLVQQIRSKSPNPPSLDEITAEVEKQRSEMYDAAR